MSPFDKDFVKSPDESVTVPSPTTFTEKPAESTVGAVVSSAYAGRTRFNDVSAVTKKARKTFLNFFIFQSFLRQIALIMLFPLFFLSLEKISNVRNLDFFEFFIPSIS